MTTITEFLLARIAEDERVARETQAWLNPSTTMHGWMGDGTDELDGFVERFTPARVLAECEAQRRIVDIHYDSPVDDDEYGWIHLCGACSPEAWPCATLRALASVYADHEDYREEWRA